MPIDAQEFGRMQAEVAALRRDNERLVAVFEKLSEQLEHIEGRLAEAHGSWRALMWLGGAGATLGSLATWALQHIALKG